MREQAGSSQIGVYMVDQDQAAIQAREQRLLGGSTGQKHKERAQQQREKADLKQEKAHRPFLRTPRDGALAGTRREKEQRQRYPQHNQREISRGDRRTAFQIEPGDTRDGREQEREARCPEKSGQPGKESGQQLGSARMHSQQRIQQESAEAKQKAGEQKLK